METQTAPLIVDAVELIAVLSPTEGNQASGVVTFKPVGNGKAEVDAQLTGLPPNSKHAIHIHQSTGPNLERRKERRRSLQSFGSPACPA